MQRGSLEQSEPEWEPEQESCRRLRLAPMQDVRSRRTLSGVPKRSPAVIRDRGCCRIFAAVDVGVRRSLPCCEIVALYQKQRWSQSASAPGKPFVWRAVGISGVTMQQEPLRLLQGFWRAFRGLCHVGCGTPAASAVGPTAPNKTLIIGYFSSSSSAYYCHDLGPRFCNAAQRRDVRTHDAHGPVALQTKS